MAMPWMRLCSSGRKHPPLMEYTLFFERKPLKLRQVWYLGSATQGYDTAHSCWVVTMVTYLFSPRMLILTSRMVWKPSSWRFQWRIRTRSRRKHPGTSQLHISHSNVRQIKINFHLITCCKSWYFVLTNSHMILFWWYFVVPCSMIVLIFVITTTLLLSISLYQTRPEKWEHAG